MEYSIYLYLFFIGISIGSYTNNIAYRINTNMKSMNDFNSILNSDTPKYSECPICNNRLKWWMNIPIFSWFYLKGKCYFCKSKIPFLYVFSEITFGCIFMIIYLLNNNLLNSFLIFLIYVISYLNISIYFIENAKILNKLLMFINILFCILYIFAKLFII
jgi:leader peptidase (prepilin peptidase)/N-methyltransferase